MLSYASPGHTLVYEDLVDLIREEGITSLEQVLPKLPDEFLYSYTLVYHSRSLHGASYDFPRAILFGNNAKLIITFNGKEDHGRYNDLEIMQFRDDERAFELRSITFDNGVVFSEKNPVSCLGCHGTSPRPIWSSYEYSEDEGVTHWPGFYGSIHDAPRLVTEEEKGFRSFRERAAEHPRYRHLRLRHRGSRWYPFGAGPYRHKFRPNNRLGNLLARLNARRLAHHLRRGAFFEAYPSLSMLWVLRCPEASTATFTRFVEDRFSGTYPSFVEARDSAGDSPERFGFMFEKLLSGPELLTWNMELDPAAAGHGFFTGIVHMDELVAAELLRGFTGGHWLQEFYVPWSQRDLYDTFKSGYYDNNVAPGGVGAQYDAIGLFYDRDQARAACPELSRRALSELNAAES